MADGRDDLTVFVHLLRAAGVDVGTHQAIAFVEAAHELSPVDEVDLYWAGRASLVVHHDDLPVYERVFRAWFQQETVAQPSATVSDEREPAPAAVDVRPDAPEVGDDDGDDDDVAGAIASAVELLRTRRFDQATPEEMRRIQALMRAIVVRVPHRVSRRTGPVRRGRVPDLRRSLHHAVQTDGELIRRAWRRRRTRPRTLVLVLDVSGSMAGYSRALLHFAFGARLGAGDVEVFCFGTRLTRVTDAFSARDLDASLDAAAAQVVDWDGGTLIADSIATLTRTHGRSGLLRGAVVVICSDGLERGDPDALGREMARLHRLAHAVVWVNPLKADARYEPLARGMAAALPHLDRFVAGHDLASLEGLADAIAER